MAIKLKWSSLLQLTELDFIPEAPKVLNVSDELVQSLSWLTGATRHDRKLLRCDENGAILVSNAWNGLNVVQTVELHPDSGVPDTFTAMAVNKGILIATSTQIVMVDLYQTDDSDYERIYISPGTLYWYPHKTIEAIVATVPYTGGTASYVGITAFN